jgi:plastocyanin
MTRRILAAGAVLLLLAAGCGDDDDANGVVGAPTDGTAPADGTADPEDTDPREAQADLSISGSQFQLSPVEAGSQVTVTNEDGIPHTLTADDGSFDTGQISGGGTATFTAPDEAGEHPVHCEIHAGMTATLEVT